MSRPTLSLLAIITSLVLSAFALAYPPPGGGGGGGGGSTPPADPAIVLYDQRGGLVVMNADGARRTIILQASSGSFWYPCWSPDGGSVCFGISARLADGIVYQGLAVLDVDVINGAPVGRNFRMLVHATGAYVLPAWSPDGTQIAYQYFNAIYTVPAGGGTPTLLHAGSDVGVTSIAWSPDSTQIVYGGGDNTTAHIRVLNVSDGSTFAVCSLTGPSGMIAVQTDWGRTSANQIVFHVIPYSATGQFIYTVEAAPGATPQLVVSGGWSATWSPDDSKIAYSTGSNYGIVIRNLTTGSVTSTGAKGRHANWRRF